MTDEEQRLMACFEARARMEEDPTIVQSFDLIPYQLHEMVWGALVLAYHHGAGDTLQKALDGLDAEAKRRIAELKQ